MSNLSVKPEEMKKYVAVLTRLLAKLPESECREVLRRLEYGSGSTEYKRKDWIIDLTG